jgi:pyruvate,water dikinase
MTDSKNQMDSGLLNSLEERAKELACLYRVEEILRDLERPIESVIELIVHAIPQGWQHPESCRVRVRLDGHTHQTEGFVENAWGQCAGITVQGQRAGEICVHYCEEICAGDGGPFLPEELKLVETIAERIGHFVLHQRLRAAFDDVARLAKTNGRRDWQVALELLRTTDPSLYDRVARRMLNQLCWQGLESARELLEHYGADLRTGRLIGEVNQPGRRSTMDEMRQLRKEIFLLAAAHLSSDEIEDRIQRWVSEDKAGHLVRPLMDTNIPLGSLGEAVRRYQHERDRHPELSESTAAGLRVAMIRRLVTDRLDFINIAKQHIDIDDFLALTERILGPIDGTGKLGGKSAGLFLAAQILKQASARYPILGTLRTPRTWYVASDGLLAFVRYNNLNEVWEQKYKPLEAVRQDYPHIVQLFKSSHFPREIGRGLAQVLDELGDVPLVVRSSSLLEDQLGAAFSGKYKSLFLANRGTREERLGALEDAIAEVYASVFGPDPIEYRAERGLLDFHEEMGILIQEVVGERVGRYFLPAFAGVAFSRNEFRWSPRIQREDGLVRLVPGLGTRAVDRLTDDFPVLVAPGRPDLRVNASFDEVLRYSPKKVDVIDLETNRFVTRPFHELVRELGEGFPMIRKLVSVIRDGHLQRPMPFTTDYAKESVACTFEALISSTPFVESLSLAMESLEDALGCPVDIEFAHDGEHFYLLQCRPQSQGPEGRAAEIPRGIPDEDVVFTARRYVSNGQVPDLQYLVYVDPVAYASLPDEAAMLAVGRVVGLLNRALPRRRFALLGPGRWGSRGDIQLGVRVTYSDISNTALLIEVARRKGSYVPDLSFGTHFFQDLVESSIRYLPLYPDEHGVVFDEAFMGSSPNALAAILPEEAEHGDIVRVIDVPSVSAGRVLRVLMNAEEDEAVAFLARPDGRPNEEAKVQPPPRRAQSSHRATGQDEAPWCWRLRMAREIASQLAPDRFGLAAVYLFGSTKNATAGPGSDIDLLLHFQGSRQQRRDLEHLLEGWSRCLAELNFLRTGHRRAGLLDLHFVSDEEVEKRAGFAARIGAVSDAAQRLELGGGWKDPATR